MTSSDAWLKRLIGGQAGNRLKWRKRKKKRNQAGRDHNGRLRLAEGRHEVFSVCRDVLIQLKMRSESQTALGKVEVVWFQNI